MNQDCRTEPRQHGSPAPLEPGWLAGCAFTPLHARPGDGVARSAGTPRLSHRHKRELATLAAAAVVSTVIALAPLVLHQASDPSALEATPLIVTGVFLPEAAISPIRVVSARAGDGDAVYARPAGRGRDIQLARANTHAARGGIALARLESSAIGAAAPARLVRFRESSLPSRDTRPGGLTRLLLGSGRHRVQPFPQPDGS